MTESSSVCTDLSHYAVLGRQPDAGVPSRSRRKKPRRWCGELPVRRLFPGVGATRQNLGYPPERYDAALVTTTLDGITEYEPADLTITAQAGMTIAALQAALAAQGQYLPLDIARPAVQTLGGVIAARANSLRRFSCGSVRDLLLGVSVVNAGARGSKAAAKSSRTWRGTTFRNYTAARWGHLA